MNYQRDNHGRRLGSLVLLVFFILVVDRLDHRLLCSLCRVGLFPHLPQIVVTVRVLASDSIDVCALARVRYVLLSDVGVG